MKIPSKSEVLQLLNGSPLTVLSFANRLFASEEFSQRELFEIFANIVDKVSGDDCVHLWEAATLMARRKLVDAAEDWFLLAKKRLMSPKIDPSEEGAIREFLGDQRIYISDAVASNYSGDTSEFVRYMKIFHAGMTVDALGFPRFFSLLAQAAGDESFLIRDVCADALCTPCTRNDIEDDELTPFKQQIQSILQQLSKDDEPFVRESLKTTRYLLELSDLA